MKTKREIKVVLDNLVKAVKNLDTCESTKLKVKESSRHLAFCDANRLILFEAIESTPRTDEGIDAFKELRLEFLDKYKTLWIKETQLLYKELGEILNEKHSVDLNTVLSTPEHDVSSSEDDSIPF